MIPVMVVSYPAPKVDAVAEQITINLAWQIIYQLFGLGWDMQKENRDSYERVYKDIEAMAFNNLLHPVEGAELEEAKQKGYAYKFDGVWYANYSSDMRRYNWLSAESAYKMCKVAFPDLTGYHEHLLECIPFADITTDFMCWYNTSGGIQMAIEYNNRFYKNGIPKICNNPDHAIPTPGSFTSQVKSIADWIGSKVSYILDDYSLVQNQPNVRDLILEYGKLSMTKEELLNLLDIFEKEFGYIGGSGDIIDVDLDERGKFFFDQQLTSGNDDFTASIATPYQSIPLRLFDGGLYYQLYTGGGAFPLKLSNKSIRINTSLVDYDDSNFKHFKLQWYFVNANGTISQTFDNAHSGIYRDFDVANLRHAVVTDVNGKDFGIALAYDSRQAIGANLSRRWRALTNGSSVGLGLDAENDIAADGRVGIIGSISNPFVDIDVNIKDRRREIEERLKDLDDADRIDILPQVKNDELVEPYPIPRDIPVDRVIDNSIPKDIVQDIELPDFPDLPSFNTSPKIAHKFPFSIPFDIMAGIKLLAVNPTTPVFEIPIKFDSKAFKFDKTIVLDFDFIAPIAKFSRWLFTIIFVLFLALGTRRLIMG